MFGNSSRLQYPNAWAYVFKYVLTVNVYLCIPLCECMLICVWEYISVAFEFSEATLTSRVDPHDD